MQNAFMFLGFAAVALLISIFIVALGVTASVQAIEKAVEAVREEVEISAMTFDDHDPAPDMIALLGTQYAPKSKRLTTDELAAILGPSSVEDAIAEQISGAPRATPGRITGIYVGQQAELRDCYPENTVSRSVRRLERTDPLLAPRRDESARDPRAGLSGCGVDPLGR